MTTKPRPLSLKQQRFVQALPSAKSATDAARIAGYSNTGATATVKASQLVRNVNVRQALAAQQQAAETAGILSLSQRKLRLSQLASRDPDHPDPVRAIAELNRMERVYDDRPSGDTFNTVVLAGYSLDQLEGMLRAIQVQARPALPGDVDRPSEASEAP